MKVPEVKIAKKKKLEKEQIGEGPSKAKQGKTRQNGEGKSKDDTQEEREGQKPETFRFLSEVRKRL